MPDPDLFTAFVDERPVRVPRGADALAAVRAVDVALAEAVVAGGAYLTDGRGIRCEAAAALTPGAILRVVVSARRTRDSDADA